MGKIENKKMDYKKLMEQHELVVSIINNPCLKEECSPKEFAELLEKECSKINTLDFLKYFREYINDGYVDEYGIKNEREKHNLEFIKAWLTQKIMKVEMPEIEDFWDVINDVMEKVKYTPGLQINYLLQKSLEKVKNKKDFLLYLIDSLEEVIQLTTDILANKKTVNDETKEENTFYLDSLRNDQMNFEFALNAINDLKLIEETENDKSEPPSIDSQNRMQKVLLMIKFGMIEHLVSLNEYDITEPKAYKLLSTLTGIKSETIRKSYQGYKKMKGNIIIHDKNNPENEDNLRWLTNLLIEYKINKIE